MRVLFILHQFYPEFRGGTESVTLKLAKAAQHAGHSAHVLACVLGRPTQNTLPADDLPSAVQTVYEGIEVTLLPRAIMSGPIEYSFETDEPLVAQLATWMQNKGFNVAHILHPMRMASSLLALQRCRIPYVVSLTDFFFLCFRINMIDATGQLCPGPQTGGRCGDHCLCVPWSSEGLKNRYLQAQGLLAAAGSRVCPSRYVADRYQEAFPNLAFSVIPHGLDLSNWAGQPRSAVDPAEKKLTLGYVGTIVPQKGLATLLRAFSSVKDAGLQLRVIGGFYGDPVYHDEVKRLAATDPRIALVGEIAPDQVHRHLRQLDLLCLPSHVPESFSLVLNEAAAMGVPTLVSDLGAPGERVAQYGCGLALPAGDVEAWTRAIAEIAAKPECLAVWRAQLPLPLRVEEEAFFYESLYRQLLQPS